MQAMMGKGPAKPTYTFLTQVVRDVTSPMESPGLMLMGKFDTEGRVDSVLMKKLGGGWNMKLSGNFMNNKTEDGALGADFEYEDSESASILRFQHHPMQGLVGSWNFMQRVHRNIMVGFDFTHLVPFYLFSLLTRNKCSAMVLRFSWVIKPCTPLQFKVEYNTIWVTLSPFAKVPHSCLTINMSLKPDQLQYWDYDSVTILRKLRLQ